MNLYKVLVKHIAPKGISVGIKTYLLAENEEQVYSFIDKEYNYEGWSDEEKEDSNFKDEIIKIKGNMNDDDYDCSDAYYGITLYGWELIEENTTFDYTHLIDMDVISVCTSNGI